MGHEVSQRSKDRISASMLFRIQIPTGGRPREGETWDDFEDPDDQELTNSGSKGLRLRRASDNQSNRNTGSFSPPFSEKGKKMKTTIWKKGGHKKREEWVYCPKLDNVFWPELETKQYRQRKCPRCGEEHVWPTKEKKGKLT